MYFILSAVDCGSPPDLPHGNVTFQDTIYGNVAVYECDMGFRLMGQSNRTCLASGLWSTEVILCVGESMIFQRNGLSF